MVAKKKVKRVIVGSKNQKQKSISTKLIRSIEAYRKQLQLNENIKFGRKARSISFAFASNNPRGLSKFIMEVRK